MTDAVMKTYGRLPVTFVRGQGTHLWDDKERAYFDALSGIAVCNLGHAHSAVTNAICEQSKTLLHTSNLYQIPNQNTLAERLTGLAGMDNVFFCNSGAEANEAAIKLARMHGHQQGIEKPAIIVMEQSFHGRTMATLSATGNRKVQAGFEPLVQGFIRVPYNDVDAIEQIAAHHNEVCAILVEPVQGEGGVHIPDADYLAQLRRLCDEHNWLLMLDEVQTGMGRTGKMFAFQHSTITPDVMSLAKGLGNGVPIGACLARGAASALLQPGNHGSTFGGNPLACAAALAVLDTMEEDKLLERVQELGSRISSALDKELADKEYIKDIRVLGLMIGIELDRPCSDLVSRALHKGLLINVTADSTVRLLPPFIMTDNEADELLHDICELITDFTGPAVA